VVSLSRYYVVDAEQAAQSGLFGRETFRVSKSKRQQRLRHPDRAVYPQISLGIRSIKPSALGSSILLADQDDRPDSRVAPPDAIFPSERQ
jgi:hypothetical protein